MRLYKLQLKKMIYRYAVAFAVTLIITILI